MLCTVFCKSTDRVKKILGLSELTNETTYVLKISCIIKMENKEEGSFTVNVSAGSPQNGIYKLVLPMKWVVLVDELVVFPGIYFFHIHKE